MENEERGNALMRRLEQKMRSEGDSVTALAVKLRISQAYLSQLLSGDKSLGKASDEVLRAIAVYLRLPSVVCFLSSGKLLEDDFVRPEVSLEEARERALRYLADSTFALEAGVDDVELKSLPGNVKQLLLTLYQVATGTRIDTPHERWFLATTQA